MKSHFNSIAVKRSHETLARFLIMRSEWIVEVTDLNCVHCKIKPPDHQTTERRITHTTLLLLLCYCVHSCRYCWCCCKAVTTCSRSYCLYCMFYLIPTLMQHCAPYIFIFFLHKPKLTLKKSCILYCIFKCHIEKVVVLQSWTKSWVLLWKEWLFWLLLSNDNKETPSLTTSPKIFLKI